MTSKKQKGKAAVSRFSLVALIGEPSPSLLRFEPCERRPRFIAQNLLGPFFSELLQGVDRIRSADLLAHQHDPANAQSFGGERGGIVRDELFFQNLDTPLVLQGRRGREGGVVSAFHPA